MFTGAQLETWESSYISCPLAYIKAIQKLGTCEPVSLTSQKVSHGAIGSMFFYCF